MSEDEGTPTGNDQHAILPFQPRDVQHRSNPLADRALAKYLDLGEERSLEKVYEWMQKEWPKENIKVPSRPTLYNWSGWWAWKNRAHQYDAEIAAREREQSIKETVKLRKQRREKRISRAQDFNELIYQITHIGEEKLDKQGNPITEYRLRHAKEITPSMIRAAIALSVEASRLEAMDIGVGPEQAGAITEQMVTMTEDQAQGMYDRIEAGVMRLQRLQEIREAQLAAGQVIEGDIELEEDVVDGSEVAGAWDAVVEDSEDDE